MANNRLKNSIKILEYAVRLLREKSNEGLHNLSLMREPFNVVRLKHLNSDDDFGINTLMACQGIPSLILLSLTVEQTLKLLIKQESGEECKTHKLRKLFDKLSIGLKDEITNQVMFDLKIDLKSFNEKLLENNTVFVDWRYLYESQFPKTAGFGFLLTLNKRLKEKII